MKTKINILDRPAAISHIRGKENAMTAAMTTVGNELLQRLWDAGSAPDGLEQKRAAGRRAISIPVKLSAGDTTCTGRTLNVTPESLCIFSRNGIRAGTVVAIYADGQGWHGEWRGRVVHCTQTVGGWKLGLLAAS